MKAKVHCSYLYADGHAVIIYEKHDKQAGTVQWAEIVEKLGPQCSFKGRIVFHNAGLLTVARMAHNIRAATPDTTHGSENTKKRGLAIGYMTMDLSGNYDGNYLHFYDMPDLIGGAYCYQPEVTEDFNPEAYHWAEHRVAKIHRVKQPAKLETVAA